MSDEDIKKIILSELKSLHKKADSTENCVTELQKSFALHEQKTEYELKEINKTNTHQNTILEEHRKTGLALEKKNDLMTQQLDQKVFGEKGLEPRVSNLEKPRKWLSQTWKILAGVGTGAGILYVTIKVLQAIGLIVLL